MRKKPRAADMALYGSRFVRKWIYEDLEAFHMESMLFVRYVELQIARKSDPKKRAALSVEL